MRIVSIGVLAATMGLGMFSVASGAVLRGTVTDTAGKPVRGALVKATAGIKSISRFTQNDGRYQITVASGNYDIAVEAYGFEVKKTSVDGGKADALDFRLSPSPPELSRLTSSELESLLPDTPEMRLVIAKCDECHSFPTVLHWRGMSAAQWKTLLPSMTKGSTNEPMANVPPAEMDAISAALGKYFGPDSPFSPRAEPLDARRIQHVDLSDEALRATVVEYDVPTKNSKPHSIEVDPKTNVAWFGEESYFGNKLTGFDINSETFHEYPLLTEKARPHTGGISEDGTYWIALAHANDPAKLASLNPRTGEVQQYYWPEKSKVASHTLTLDRKGNVWLTGAPLGELWAFDIASRKFRAYTYPISHEVPSGSMLEWQTIPGEPAHAPVTSTYDVAVDNEGMVWFSQISLGTLLRLDPATGSTKTIRPEGVVSIRGITVDANDNLWFGDFHGHRFGGLNVKTGAVKFYKPPTPNATVYGITVNKTDRSIWFADMDGNHITRFNPTTEQFTEFPIPSRPDRTYARFIGADAKGRVWFTEYFGDKIGYVDPAGETNK